MNGLRRLTSTMTCVICLVPLAGCTTNADTRAVATQLVATAEALKAYYATLRTLTVQTDELNAIEVAVEHTPYTAADRQRLLDREGELDKRMALASGLSALAQSFATLDGSAADVDSAADKLESEAHGMTPLVPNARVQAAIDPALQSALHELVGAIQRGKEREAAQRLDDTIAGLASFFKGEEREYAAIETTYSQIASDVAGLLVRGGQVDETASLAPALSPFGLVPRLAASPDGMELKARLQPLLIQQIALRMAAMNLSSASATGDMQTALDELSQRVHRLAKGEPMRLRMPPPMLKGVEHWTEEIDGVATLVNKPPAS